MVDYRVLDLLVAVAQVPPTQSLVVEVVVPQKQVTQMPQALVVME